MTTIVKLSWQCFFDKIGIYTSKPLTNSNKKQEITWPKKPSHKCVFDSFNECITVNQKLVDIFRRKILKFTHFSYSTLYNLGTG